MKDGRDYYVYVYIDPRNNEEFYYGKGRGNRKSAHLLARGDSAKVKRIREIRKEGEQPKIKVVAAELTQDQAFLVESTLLWKLGKNLTNAVAGMFASKFRPHNTLHKELPGFDFNHAIHLVNVGEVGSAALRLKNKELHSADCVCGLRRSQRHCNGIDEHFLIY